MAFFTRRSEQDDTPQAQAANGNGEIEIEEIRDVLRRASLGDLDARVSHVMPNSRLAGLADDVNRFLDLVDSYLRESESTLTAAAEGRSYRRFLTRGMLGAFTTNAQQINVVIDTFNTLRADTPDTGDGSTATAQPEKTQDPAAPASDDRGATPPIPHTAW